MGPPQTLEEIAYPTARGIGWFNLRRLYQHCGDMPPAELEDHYYAQTRAQQTAGLSTT